MVTRRIAAIILVTLLLHPAFGQTAETPKDPGGVFFAQGVVCVAVPLGADFSWPYSLSLLGNSVATLFMRLYEEQQGYLNQEEYEMVQEAALMDVVALLYSWAHRMRPVTENDRAEYGDGLYDALRTINYTPGSLLLGERGGSFSTELTLCVRESDHSVVDDPPHSFDAPLPTTAPVPADNVPLSGTPLAVDRWVVTAGNRDGGIQFRNLLGSQGFGERADSGYTFALVPVSVKNDTTRTESLGFARWVLSDDVGYEYTPQTLADFHLGDDRLDVVDIPPGATRRGFLVFQVRSGVRWLTLQFGSGHSALRWRFIITQ